MKNSRMLKLLSITLIFVFVLTNVAFAGVNSTKKETVYVTLTPDGTAKSQIVTDWIHSDKPDVIVKDKSELENIINLKGDEAPQKQGEYLTWKLNGNDLFYQGTTSKALPFDVSIKYFLDGNKINPQDLAGKSGKVKIRIEVENKQKKEVSINGQPKDVYVPFTFAFVVNLPQDKFTNVKVNSGEIVTDGNTQAVVSLLFPGLLESLGIEKDVERVVKIPKYIEISADCKDFELSSIYILATNKLINFGDVKNINSFDELKNSLNTLYTSSQKILDGTINLSEGQREFCLNFEKFNEGIKKLADGSNRLYTGAEALKEGVDKLYNSSGQLKNGADELLKNSQKLYGGLSESYNGVNDYIYGTQQFSDGAIKAIDGYKLLFDKNKELLDAVKKAAQGVASIQAEQKNLNDGTKELQQALNNVLEGNKKELEVLNLVYSGFDAITSALEKLTSVPLVKDAAESILAGVNNQKEAIKGLIDSKNSLISGLSQILDNMNKIEEGQEQLLVALNQLNDAESKISSSADLIVQNQKMLENASGEVEKGKQKLDSASLQLLQGNEMLFDGIKKFNDGMNTFGKGISQFTGGISQLKNGADEFAIGFKEFNENMNAVNDASGKLYSGAIQVRDGLSTLSSNYAKFHKEGIKELYTKSSETFDKINDVKETLEVIRNLSNNYKTFTGISDGMNGEVKFVLKTDEIKAKSQEKNIKAKSTTTMKSEKKGFIQWLLGLLHKSI